MPLYSNSLSPSTFDKLVSRLRGDRKEGRDRSRSLCVEKLAAAIIRPGFVDPTCIVARDLNSLQRRRASSAITSSNDLISRRGVFSRRHYGSVELLPQVEANDQDAIGRRFRVENGESLGGKEEIFGSPSTPVLENPEYQTRWYFKYFLGKLHQNYVGVDSEKVPFFLSVVLTDTNSQCVPQYRVILWKKTGAQKISLSYTPNKPMTVKQILSNFPNMEKLEKGPKEIFAPDVQKDLLLLEEQEGSVNFKFGCLYTRPGQVTDDEMFSNETGSVEFERFTALLGDKIRLKGWDKYRGGLDVKGDMTGKYSVYTIYEGHEIMFHVSTLLPYSKDNKQQVERKRHIGNDIVNIVFVEGGPSEMVNFNPSCIKSHFTHVFAVVSYCAENSSYRLVVYSEESVPLFGPSLPCPSVFKDPSEFREFLLVKLINGEKATFNTPIFAQKRERTLDMLIKDLCAEQMGDASRATMLNRRAFSDVLPDPPRGSRRKEEARQVEFVRIGQALKLETIVKGDAPTSLATTGLYKRAPWEPHCFYPDFSHEIICGDSWGESKLVVSTETGVFLVEDGLSHKQIFDKSVVIKQLNVVEAHGILLFRADKGRDSKIHVFRLSDFDSDCQAEPRVYSRPDLKEHKLDRTKGSTMYAVSRPGGSHLRMVVSLGKKLLVMQWRHSAAWTAWCPASDTDTVDGFQCLREISIPESPTLMTLVDSSVAASAGGIADNTICIGYKNMFDIVNERSGEVNKLFSIAEGTKAHLIAAVDLYEDEEPELLLCYNNTCHFQKLSDNTSNTDFDFHWNSIPTAIVCAFPYVLAFTSDSMEIRLIINGNLVQTMAMPKLRLITSKNDIFFATTAPEFFQSKPERLHMDMKTERDNSLSPPSSPHSISPEARPFRLYRIPLHALSGIVAACERRCPTPSPEPQPGTGESSSSSLSPGSRLLAEPPRGISRSCSSSPTPQSFLQQPK
ncbi:GTPase-activating Rap/Ran-GAP domain-like protein 3 isoform X2 [Cimex lectularius]|uniref:GTPase-activating Rap/Ran-GAP domain-like protein 3 n=1 Tax=Cimex lectularius TaxID=79782 RepID=A0A8I6SD93_CIMLE|nr:GTPase-activating Rap/Ran-GAP domain-like protein 3 isoform X2 [Cimex lectularius]